MLTLQELQTSQKKHRKEHEDSGQVRVRDVVPNIDDDTLICRGEARSSQPGKSYDLVFLFHKVIFALFPGPSTPVSVNLGRNRTLFTEQIEEESHSVQASCTCQDYIMTWAHWNKEEDSLYGPEKAYTRKTTTRPERNPEHAPGLCKHLMEFIDALRKRKIIAAV